MIGGPPGLRRLDLEPDLGKIEGIDKRIDHSNRIFRIDPIAQAFRKKCRLTAIPVAWGITLPRSEQERFHTARVRLGRVSAGEPSPLYYRSRTCGLGERSVPID